MLLPEVNNGCICGTCSAGYNLKPVFINTGVRSTTATGYQLASTTINDGARGTTATGYQLASTTINDGARGTTAAGDMLGTLSVDDCVCRSVTSTKRHGSVYLTSAQCLIGIISRQRRRWRHKQAGNQSCQCGALNLTGALPPFAGQF